MKYKISIILFITISCILFGCGKEEGPVTGDVNIYCVSINGQGLETVEYELKSQDVESQVRELFEQLKKSRESKEITSSVPSNVELEKIDLNDRQLSLYFGTSYYEMKKSTEVLMRAAVVQTMTQLSGVDYVSFYVGKDALKDSYGEVIGIMNAENFLQNATYSLDAYQKTSLKLYFATTDGLGLKEEHRADVHYNPSTSIEKLVLKQLMDGPDSESLSPTIPETVKLLGVSVKEGVCYVNLTSSFLTNIYNQKPEVTIYSIVNSLVANTKVLKVQILIDGSADTMFLNTVDLSKPLEWNAEILEGQEES